MGPLISGKLWGGSRPQGKSTKKQSAHGTKELRKLDGKNNIEALEVLTYMSAVSKACVGENPPLKWPYKIQDSYILGT